MTNDAQHDEAKTVDWLINGPDVRGTLHFRDGRPPEPAPKPPPMPKMVAAGEMLRDAISARDAALARADELEKRLYAALIYTPLAQDSPSVQPQSAGLAYVVRDGRAALSPGLQAALDEAWAAAGQLPVQQEETP